MGHDETNQPADEASRSAAETDRPGTQSVSDGSRGGRGGSAGPPAAAVVAIGASAGGVQALCSVMAGLPAAFPAAVFVVLHVLARGHSMLAPILARAGALEALVAQDGEAVIPGRVYVGPPDVHTLVVDDRVRLSAAPPEKGARPSINALFRSVAGCYGPRAVGVVLSGTLDDGADGLRAIGEHGGTALVQDPADAQFDGMPVHAIEASAGARVLPAAAIAAALVELVGDGGVQSGGVQGDRVQGDGVDGGTQDGKVAGGSQGGGVDGGVGAGSKAEPRAQGT